MLSIFKKEINSFFSSLVGYIVIGVFLLTLGWIMWIYPDTSILENEFATLDQLFIGAPLILSFIIPAITMRSFAEEHQIGTIELLTTKPILDLEIIFGKFLASMTLVILMLIPTLIYFYSVYQLGSPVGNIDTGGVIGSYIGLLFLSGAFVAIGLLCSSLTKNIIASLILGIFACIFLYWGFDLISELPIYFGKGDTLIQMLGIDYHYTSVRRGLLDTRDLLYFISVIGIFLSLTLISFNSRKWWVQQIGNRKGKIIEVVIGIAPILLIAIIFSNTIGLAASLIIGGLIGGLAYTLVRAFNNKNSSTFHSLIQPLLSIPIFLFIGVLGNFIFTKFDLTDDKRFTLTVPSVKMLEGVDEVMDITVLLDGNLPADYMRLQNSTREMLDDFRSYSSWIEYSFENPTEGSIEEVQANIAALGKQDIEAVSIQIPGVDSRELKYIFPYAIINYKGRTTTINLLEAIQPGMTERGALSKSVNLLEFKFMNALQKMESSFRPVITYTVGHGELDPLQFADLRKSLFAFYDMGGLNLDSLVEIDSNVDILLIPKPRLPFSQKDLFKIDQYVMRGGKVLWALDVMDMTVDSIAAQRGSPYIAGELPSAEGISNLLFKYGIRIRPSNFIFDVESSRIPLQTGVQGNTPKFELFPWYYHPIISPKSNHPIVKGLDRINMFFPTIIDTAVGVRTNLKKEVLLSSSAYTKIRPNTHRFSFEEVNVDTKKLEFTDKEKPVAVLLEGTFPSAYRNRVSSAMSETLKEIGSEYKEESVPTKMIVISDGDVMKNLVDARSKQYSPLGFNKYESYTFANKDFMMNCIEYLMDDNDVLESRSKEIELRLLDKVSAQKNKGFWRFLNNGIPLILLILSGLIYTFIRRKRYTN
jgi:gliding-associated putative ABC transporter substrate-binding component GldG/gliding motility-associated ABC transporter permease protein GldF